MPVHRVICLALGTAIWSNALQNEELLPGDQSDKLLCWRMIGCEAGNCICHAIGGVGGLRFASELASEESLTDVEGRPGWCLYRSCPLKIAWREMG